MSRFALEETEAEQCAGSLIWPISEPPLLGCNRFLPRFLPVSMYSLYPWPSPASAPEIQTAAPVEPELLAANILPWGGGLALITRHCGPVSQAPRREQALGKGNRRVGFE